MGQTIEVIARIALWAFLMVNGIALVNGWWSLDMAEFKGLVLIVLSVLVIKGAG
jgi:hypothetical protein